MLFFSNRLLKNEISLFDELNKQILNNINIIIEH